MKKLSVYIEINGIRTYVGKIKGDSVNSAVFTYAKDYLSLLGVLGKECLGAIQILNERRKAL